MSIVANGDDRLLVGPTGCWSVRAVLLGLLFVAAGTFGAGCSGGAETGQVVVGIVTDLHWPSPLANVGIQVFKADSGGSTKTPVGGGEVAVLDSTHGLPGTYVLQSETQGWVRIEITGLDEALSPLAAGTPPVIAPRAAVVLVVPGEVRFLRVALVDACIGKTCLPLQTCIEGTCASPVEQTTAYTPAETTSLDCAGPSNLLVTTTGQPMPVRGSCGAGLVCVEGSCRVSAGS